MKTRSPLKPWSILCVVLGVILCVILGAYRRPVMWLLYAKVQFRNEPKLWYVPRPLSLGAPGPFKGRSFAYFGYGFDSPWTELKRERKTESVVVLNFSTGEVIVVFAPAENGSELDEMKREAEKRGEDIRSVFGDEATRTNYALRSKILSLTPGDLRLVSSRQQMVADSVLLFLKKTEIATLKGGLFSFQTKQFHGFQEGGPTQDDTVTIEAFDSQDQKLKLLISLERGAASRPSQADINHILVSLHPVAPSQSTDP